MSSVLLVEGTSDRAFIQLLVNQLRKKGDLEPQYRILQGLGGFSEVAKKVKDDTEKGAIDKIGIIVDFDDDSVEDKLQYINGHLQTIFPGFEPLTATGQLTHAKNNGGDDIQIACYLMGIDGSGELETVLKTIKNRDSPYADCLDAWRECLVRRECLDQDPPITTKEFDKFWVNNYIRLDTCNKKEQKQRDKNCNPEKLEVIFERKPDIWNFEHECLTELKKFLLLFLDSG